MTLLKKIEELIHFGYDITFSHQPLNVEVRIGKEVNDKNIYRKSWLPMSDHFYESRIVECIDFMFEQTENEIKTLN